MIILSSTIWGIVLLSWFNFLIFYDFPQIWITKGQLILKCLFVDFNFFQKTNEFLIGCCLKIYFLISKICIQITPMVSQNTLDWSFFLFFDWDFISRIVLRPSLNRSSDEWIESTIPVAQSICTHYSCYENMGRFVTLKKITSKIWVAKSRVQKTGLLLLKKRSWGTSTSFLFVHKKKLLFKVSIDALILIQ